MTIGGSCALLGYPDDPFEEPVDDLAGVDPDLW